MEKKYTTRVEKRKQEIKARKEKKKATAWRIADKTVQLIVAISNIVEAFTKFV